MDHQRRTLLSLESDDCTIPASASVSISRKSVQISDLSSISSVCLGAIIHDASISSHVLRVYIATKPIVLNTDANMLSSNGILALNEYANAGLLGNNQVIGIADTGVDDLSCFFIDHKSADDDDDDGEQITLVNRDGIVEEKRRKLIQYVAFGDGLDDLNGHGTHVAGTVAGNSMNTLSNMNGIAPEAKISIFDVGKYSPREYFK